MLANFFRACDALIDRNRQLHSKLVRDRFDFLHDAADHGRGSGIARDLNQSGAGQRADRVERCVAQNLYPDLLPDASGDRAAEAGCDERFGKHTDAIGARAVGFAEGNSIALGMMNHSRRGNLSGKVNNGSAHSFCFKGGGDPSAGIDTLQAQSFPFAAEALEVPPGNFVLCAYHCSIRSQHRSQVRRKLGQAVGFHSKKNNVYRTHFFKGTGDGGARHEISLAAFDTHAVLLHGAKMRPAREQRYIESGLRHASPDVGSNCPSPRDQEFHSCPPASTAATARRRIFPVAVVGILSTRYILVGHLYSASNSRQCRMSADSAAPWGSCKTTAAHTSSPKVGCAQPNVTAAATAGCLSNISSTS